MEDKNNKSQTPIIMGMIALVIVLFAGIKLIFGFLENTLPPPIEQPPAASQQAPAAEDGAPNFCPHCGEALFEGFQWEQYCPDCGRQVTGGGAA